MEPKEIKRKKPSKLEEMSKEQIREAILRKRECNLKAQKIVESLLERNITEQYFLECLVDINQTHFDDIVEERSIVQICGYPICPRNLSPKDIPKQRYKISTKTNKVYDITTRKNFCSNTCFEAAMYIKKQMLTSPLWFREYEVMPTFNILPLGTVGSLGEVIDVALVEKIDLKKESTFISVNDLTKVSLSKLPSDSVNYNKQSDTLRQQSNIVTQDTEVSNFSQYNKDEFEKIDVIEKTIKSLNLNEKNNKLDQNLNKSKPVKKNPLNIVGDIVEKPEKKIDPIIVDAPVKVSSKKVSRLSNVNKEKTLPVQIMASEVEKCLEEWCTLDTLIFLFGEEKVKEMVKDKKELIEKYLTDCSKSTLYNANTYDQYLTLCRKLNKLGLELNKDHNSEAKQRETKPLPDYSILKEESKNMQLKVRAFLNGETDIQSSDAETKQDEPIGENTTQIPLVDKHAQNALRRRIVCSHLNNVLADLLRSLGLTTLSISVDVKLLVNTFKLRADNIMFKSLQWTFIALIMIKMLSLRDHRLKYLLDQPTAFKHLQLLLLSYNLDGEYLDRLITWVTDVDRLLRTEG